MTCWSRQRIRHQCICQPTCEKAKNNNLVFTTKNKENISTDFGGQMVCARKADQCRARQGHSEFKNCWVPVNDLSRKTDSALELLRQLLLWSWTTIASSRNRVPSVDQPLSSDDFFYHHDPLCSMAKALIKNVGPNQIGNADFFPLRIKRKWWTLSAREELEER